MFYALDASKLSVGVEPEKEKTMSNGKANLILILLLLALGCQGYLIYAVLQTSAEASSAGHQAGTAAGRVAASANTTKGQLDKILKKLEELSRDHSADQLAASMTFRDFAQRSALGTVYQQALLEELAKRSRLKPEISREAALAHMKKQGSGLPKGWRWLGQEDEEPEPTKKPEPPKPDPRPQD
jgi:hypothetical protein